MGLVKKINFILNRKQKIRLIQLTLIIIVGAFLELLGVSMIMPFMDVIMDPNVINRKVYLRFFYLLFHFETANQFLVFVAFLLIIVYVIKNLYIAAMYDAQYRFTFRNQKRISSRLYECYLKQDYLFYVKNNSAELLRNINNDVSLFFNTVLQFLQLITEISVCLVLFIYLFLMNKTITISVSIFLLIFVLAFMRLFQDKLKHLGEKNREYSAKMTKWLLQGMGGIKEIKIMHREQFFCDQYDKSYSGYAECQRKYSLLSILPRPVMETFCVSGLLLVVAFKLARGVEMSYFVTTMSVFAVAAFRMLPSFNRITNNLNGIMFGIPSVDKIYEDLKQAALLMEKINEREQEESCFCFSDNITVDSLTFSYPGVEKPVLKNISLKIPKNSSVAFIGTSGAGKTTLADIILGLMEPQMGNIYVDGKDIQGHMKTWQKKFGYIPQMIYIMDDTIKNNIILGISEEDLDEGRLWNAIEEAQLLEFIQELEEGIDTVIGENGMRMSGGQRQRIGIARALYHDPEILILDEATSALDSETETAVMNAINKFSGNKTMIIIAHRLTTIKDCDIVYKVDDQKVVETTISI